MKLSKVGNTAAALLAVAAVAGAAPAKAAGAGVEAGVLSCDVSSGWGFVFGSSKDLKCTFSNGSATEHYTGSISKFGVDIGYTQAAVMVWTVVAPSNDVGRGALAGNYMGVSGSAEIGAGGGANVLLGGGSRSITLQPVSFQGGTGLNVAGGIAAMGLTPAP